MNHDINQKVIEFNYLCCIFVRFFIVFVAIAHRECLNFELNCKINEFIEIGLINEIGKMRVVLVGIYSKKQRKKEKL